MVNPIYSQTISQDDLHSKFENSQSSSNQNKKNQLQKMTDENESFPMNVFKNDTPFRNDSKDRSLAGIYAYLDHNQEPIDHQSLIYPQEPQAQMDNLSRCSNNQLDRMDVRSVHQNYQTGSRTLTTFKFSLNYWAIDSFIFSPQIPRNSQSDSSCMESTSTGEEDEKPKKEWDHLKSKRRPKGSIQGQYPTNNLLPTAKKIHKDFILAEKGQEYFENHSILQNIFNHRATTTKEFVAIYKYEDLKCVWEKFFEEKVIFRRIKETKTKRKTVEGWMEHLDSFEYAFLTGKFERLTLCRSQELRVLKEQRKQAMREIIQQQNSSFKVGIDC